MRKVQFGIFVGYHLPVMSSRPGLSYALGEGRCRCGWPSITHSSVPRLPKSACSIRSPRLWR